MRLRATVAALATALLLVGCSDDGDDEKDSAAPSGSEPTAEVSELVANGLGELAAGEDEHARTTFEEVLELDAQNLYALYNLGVIAQGGGDDDAARDYYERALAAQDDYVPAMFNLAIVLETSDLDRSVQLYRDVLEHDEEMAAAHMRLGFALVHRGEEDEGAEHLERGVALDPAMAEIEAPTYD